MTEIFTSLARFSLDLVQFVILLPVVVCILLLSAFMCGILGWFAFLLAYAVGFPPLVAFFWGVGIGSYSFGQLLYSSVCSGREPR